MKITLSSIPCTAPTGLDQAETRQRTKALIARVGELQHLLYAEGRHSVLVVLQGMDASGKDGAIRNVFSKCNLAGTRVVSFGKPSDKERKHDFLWRTHQQTPARGELAIFNRSHYEDVLIQRVHQVIDLKRVALRMAAINSFEQLLQFDNNTTILKFFLHLSREEQESRGPFAPPTIGGIAIL